MTKLVCDTMSFILDRMLCKYEYRIDFERCWKQIAHFHSEILYAASLEDPWAAQSLLLSMNKRCFCERMKHNNLFRNRFSRSPSDYLLKAASMYECCFVLATHKTSELNMMNSFDPIYDLGYDLCHGGRFLMSEKSRLQHWQPKNDQWDMMKESLSHQNARLSTASIWRLPVEYPYYEEPCMRRIFFIGDFTRKYCGNPECLNELGNDEESIVRCNLCEFKLFGWCSKKCWKRCKLAHERYGGEIGQCMMFTSSRDEYSLKLACSVNYPMGISESDRSRLSLELKTGRYLRNEAILDPWISEYSTFVRNTYPKHLHQFSTELIEECFKFHRLSMSPRLSPVDPKLQKLCKSIASICLNSLAVFIRSTIAQELEIEAFDGVIKFMDCRRTFQSVLKHLRKTELNPVTIRSFQKHHIRLIINKLIELEKRKFEQAIVLIMRSRHFICSYFHYTNSITNVQKKERIKGESVSTTTTTSFPPRNEKTFLCLGSDKMDKESMPEIFIKQCKVNEIQINRKIILEVVEHSSNMIAYYLVVRDKDGCFRTACIYNLSEKKKRELIKGAKFVIYHPFYKVTQSGELSFRVDNPEAQIEIIPNFINVLYDATQRIDKCLAIAKEYYDKSDHWEAVRFYNKALKLAVQEKELEETILGIRNSIVECFIRTRCFAIAGRISCDSEENYWEFCEDEVILRKAKELSMMCSILLGAKLKIPTEEVEFREIAHIVSDQLRGRFNFVGILRKDFHVDFLGNFICITKTTRESVNSKDKKVARAKQGGIERGAIVLVNKAMTNTDRINTDGAIEPKRVADSAYFYGSYVRLRESLVKIFEFKQSIMQRKSAAEKVELFDIGALEKYLDPQFYSLLGMDFKQHFGFLFGEQIRQKTKYRAVFFEQAIGFQHSDNPNCNYVVLNDIIIITAKKRIEEGEVLTINFFPFWLDAQFRRECLAFTNNNLGETENSRFSRVCLNIRELSTLKCDNRIARKFEDFYPANRTLLKLYSLDLIQRSDLCEKYFPELLRCFRCDNQIFLHWIAVVYGEISRMHGNSSLSRSNRIWKCFKENILRKYEDDFIELIEGTFGKGQHSIISSFLGHSSCGFCGKCCVKLKCARCKKVHYCGKRCQKKDWKLHKNACFPQQ